MCTQVVYTFTARTVIVGRRASDTVTTLSSSGASGAPGTLVIVFILALVLDVNQNIVPGPYDLHTHTKTHTQMEHARDCSFIESISVSPKVRLAIRILFQPLKHIFAKCTPSLRVLLKMTSVLTVGTPHPFTPLHPFFLLHASN